jgi:hypothetical protein
MPDISPVKLAFVIPLYKTAYLAATLQSLSEQRNKNFTVYIGDDCSPTPPDKIIEEFSKKLNLQYVRFTENVGGINPVRNWNRCLDLVKEEEWISMLPDDDMLSPGVVEEFYQHLPKAANYPIYAFKMGIKEIDNNGVITPVSRPSGEMVTNYQFFFNLVKAKDGCSLGDVIYNKKRLLAVGKFAEFPKAWSSDHVTASMVAEGGFIYNLPSSYLLFRMSGENISSQVSDGAEKMRARYLIGKWLRKNESIWDTKPSKEFYRFFYWKSEYYFIYIWKFSFAEWRYLYKLSSLMYNSWNPMPPVKALLKRIFQRKNG